MREEKKSVFTRKETDTIAEKKKQSFYSEFDPSL